MLKRLGSLSALPVVWCFGFPDCLNGPLANTTVCDTSASPSVRANALITMFTVDELVSNSNVGAPGVPRLGVPDYQAAEEGLHGLATSPGIIFASSGDFSFATSFPAPIHMSAAFDDPAILAVGDVISTEARAFSNAGRASLDYFTPNINPFKDPRWGRGQETPGEDPYRVAQYAYNFVEGLQGGIDPPNMKIAAVCKHLAGYDLENPPGTNRFVFNAVISQQDLVSYYLPPFQSCARDAKAGAIMCGFNALNGLPSCADPFLLQTVLRDFYGFNEERWTVADCDAIEFMFDQMHFVPDFTHAAAAGMNAGVDLDCGTTYGDNLGTAIKMSLVNASTIASALKRQYASLIRQVLMQLDSRFVDNRRRLGYFDPPSAQPYRHLTWDDVNTAHAQQLAYQIAADGLVLLKNDGTLPISQNIKTLALIGPWASATTQMQSNYAGPAPFLTSLLAAAEGLGRFTVVSEPGAGVNTNDASGFAAAVSAALSADIVVYAGGLDNSCEAEGSDRTTVTWPGNQLDLIAQLATIGKPLVILQFGGGQVDDIDLKNNPNISAIIWTGYPGQSGGTAVFDILTGKLSPAGRLPTTQYPANYVDQVPMTDMTLRPSNSNPGRTYKWYTGTPTYEFGTGLGYTTFGLSFSPANSPQASYNIQALIAQARKDEPVDRSLLDTFEVVVKNTGTTTSDFVTLLFMNTTAGEGPYPKKELVSYTRAKGIQAACFVVVIRVFQLGLPFAPAAHSKKQFPLATIAGRPFEAGDLIDAPFRLGDTKWQWRLRLPMPKQVFSNNVNDELHDARRVGTHGQEEDLRSALGMVIGRVVEMSALLQEAYKSKAELEVQLNVAKSNLQLVIANNEMLEEALRSGGGNGRDVGWRRSSGAGVRQQQQQHPTQSHDGDQSPNSSPTDSQGANSRFFKTFFSGAVSSSNTRPGTPTNQGQGHLTSPSLPSLHHGGHTAEEEALSAALQAAKANAEKSRIEAERAKVEAEKMRGEKAALEAELESLSQALFEEANNMVASERKRRAEAEGQLEKLKPLVEDAREIGEELKEVRMEREALKSALRIVEGENESLRSASRLSYHGSNPGSIDLEHDEAEPGGSPPSRGMTRSRSSSQVGTKSPIRLSPSGSPHIQSFSGSPPMSGSPRPLPLAQEENNTLEDEEPIVFAPTGLRAPDVQSDDGGTPRRPVLPLNTQTNHDEQYDYEYEHVSRTTNSSPSFSPPPTATVPSVLDPWRI
ncbi:putative exo-1,4-beta-xylosidase bxlB [Mycena indigotica]|uniref:xylan 1,4-beta-xylosidase n=1 Tax=Mycena indigotica TaxID=2126181 RepID=A0A8H6T4V1_9AGAR|nr:putative exo-1,4-beta-xylosidase bxlB [Mycena indigotica]KAF7312125.1 putative exo-1,4-beta-xylosidase bxlB [Mycena indigotica]